MFVAMLRYIMIATLPAAVLPMMASAALAATVIVIVEPAQNGNYQSAPLYFKVHNGFSQGHINAWPTVESRIERYSSNLAKWEVVAPSVGYNLVTTPNGKEIWSIVKTPGKYRIRAKWNHPIHHKLTDWVQFRVTTPFLKLRKKRYPKRRIGPPPVERKLRPRIRTQ